MNMRINNILHFTENHRYCVYRNFGLSALDGKMLSSLYQPMVGAFATALYQLLYQQVPLEQVGYSAVEQQRRLFMTLGLELSEKGRKMFVEQTSKLEAVGLLQTNRIFIPENDDYIYEYELQPPLSPAEFFQTQHLTLLLRDKVGKFAVLSLQEQLSSKEPEEWSNTSVNKENVSVLFYDIFELNTHVIDYELEQAITEISSSKQPKPPTSGDNEGFNYSEIIMRFPRDSVNRSFVEQFRFNTEQLGIANYVARKYDLSVQDLCRLLDEDGVFDQDGDLKLDELQYRANLHFRQGKRRHDLREVTSGKVISLRQNEVGASAEHEEEHAVQMEYYVEVPPQFQSKCDVHQYNMMLRNEPYTRLLKTFFPGSVPDNLLDIFEKIDLNYKLPGEVINVLIHYLMIMISTGEHRINRNFVDAIASNMLLKQVDTYEKAVHYIREQSNVKMKKEASTANIPVKGRAYNNRSAKQKPEIPIVQHNEQADQVTAEEFAELLRMAERMQADKQNGRA